MLVVKNEKRKDKEEQIKESGSLEEAAVASHREKLERRILEDNENTEAWQQLAESYIKEGNYERALSCCFRLISLIPHNPRAWNKLASVFLQLGNAELATSLSKIAFRLSLNDS